MQIETAIKIDIFMASFRETLDHSVLWKPAAHK